MKGTERSRAIHVFFCILALACTRGCSAQDDKVEEAILRIEEKLQNIDDQLSDMESAIEALAERPKIADDCTVEFAAYGLDDPNPRLGYIRTSGGSSEEIFVPNDPTKNRGVTLVELDPTTCLTRNRQRFDTLGIADDILQLMETIESARVGTIIVGVTADSADFSGSVENVASPTFIRYNMDLNGIVNRDKFAFIMQKGYPKKTIFEREVTRKESIRMKVELRGSSVLGANFTRVL